MEKDRTQKQLISAYKHWKSVFNPEGLKPEDFSPPLLLNVTEEYCKARMKIIVYGKETAGWDWTSRLQECFPKYPNYWPFHDQSTFADFLNNDDAVEALCWGYREFAYAKHHPKSYNSPFWQAFRQIQSWPDTGVMYADLVRVDHNGKSVLTADRDACRAMVEQQGSLFLEELKVLAPDACIFFTGPDYDWILDGVFPELARSQINKVPQRQLARIEHNALPQRSYRTYHPNYLWQRRKRDFLDVIRDSMIGDDIG
jgi:hypothetical protein